MIMSSGTVLAPAKDDEKRYPLSQHHPAETTVLSLGSTGQAEQFARRTLSDASRSHHGDHRCAVRAILRIDHRSPPPLASQSLYGTSPGTSDNFVVRSIA